MKKTAFLLGILLLISVHLAAGGQARPDEKLFQEAKILLFDEKWEQAQLKLEELLRDYPSSSLSSQALFYKAKCLGKQRGKEEQALKAHKEYLEHKDASRSLTEESETSIIALAYDLYASGRRAYLREIEERLESPSRIVKYYAAITLSFVKDKQVNSRAIPILKQIIGEEKDVELRDRARIALLRISPDAFRKVEEERTERRVRILKIRIYEDGKEPKLSINIPWVLADLALSSIPEEDKSVLKRKGYDLDEIIKYLTSSRESLLEIREGNKFIKIWIE